VLLYQVRHEEVEAGEILIFALDDMVFAEAFRHDETCLCILYEYYELNSKTEGPQCNMFSSSAVAAFKVGR